MSVGLVTRLAMRDIPEADLIEVVGERIPAARRVRPAGGIAGPELILDVPGAAHGTCQRPDMLAIEIERLGGPRGRCGNGERDMMPGTVVDRVGRGDRIDAAIPQLAP